MHLIKAAGKDEEVKNAGQSSCQSLVRPGYSIQVHQNQKQKLSLAPA